MSTQLKRASLVSQLVNLRKRIKDNEDDMCGSAENAIGNLLWLAFSKSNMADKNDNNSNNNEKRLYGLVKKLRKAFSTINDKFIENMRSSDNLTRKSTMLQSLNIKSMLSDEEEEEEEEVGLKNHKQEDEEVDSLGFSSWCNLGFYEVDFGWGKPLWVSSIGICGSYVFMNLVILVDPRFNGDDGIEAWVTLDESLMAHFETNPQLLGYAILDPSPSSNLSTKTSF